MILLFYYFYIIYIFYNYLLKFQYQDNYIKIIYEKPNIF